jgi:bifunctional DNase/RNase
LETIHHLIVANLLPSSVGSNSFILLLESKENHKLKFPIVIGYNEAQAITIEIEGIKPSRPLTHDLFVNMQNQLSIIIDSISITKFSDGIFYATINLISSQELIGIDSRPSDAIAIALRTKAPIKISKKLLESLSINENVIDIEVDEKIITKKTSQKSSFDDLNNLLKEALINENYELAAKLRDDIFRLKNTNEFK